MDPDVTTRCVPAYRFLDAAQIERFHKATLEVLETVGVKVLHAEAREMLAGRGCRVSGDDLVLIPARLVEEAIASAPARIVIHNRTGRPAMHLEGRNSHFGLGTDLAKTYDLRTGQLRQSCLADVATAARIADACEEIDFIASYALPYDSPANLVYIDAAKTELENSVKPIFFTAADRADLAVVHQMACAVAGGRQTLRQKPFLIHYSEPMSPLVHTHSGVAKLFYCADHLIPVMYIPGMMSGASAPVTLAGSIVQGNAEALSGVVLHQLRAPGAPIISGFGTSTLDMHTGTCIYGCPEYRLALSAAADLYHHYGIPVFGTAGASDANLLDQQAAMEWGLSLLNDALNGINFIHDVGYLGQGLIGHPAGIVICNEIIGYVRRMLRGIELDNAHLALEEIKRVGPKGHYLATRHTRQHHRSEHWRPRLANRSALDQWLENGGPSWGEEAVKRALEILQTHQPEPLGNDLQAMLNGIREKALRDLGHIHFEC
jgi:trimethylamine---corrinoid protein Co-methyltransferase